jgi:hypothetical protein
MSPNLRTALLAGGIAVGLLVAGGIGYAIGRAASSEARGRESPRPSGEASSASPVPTSTGSVEASNTGSPAVAIGATGAILRASRASDVTLGPSTIACGSLVTPGLTGECGDVNVSGGRVVWVVERAAVANGVSGFRVRILVYSPTDGGWIQRLAADDLGGRRWSSIAVLPADLTNDGVPELLVGYRGVSEREPLDLDVVGYAQDGAPEVLAHPDRADRGAVLVNAAAQLLEYAAQYAAGEAPCCPGAYERRTIVFEGGVLRQVATEEIAPSAVPPSQL